jgi:hypothetical protein
MHYAMKAYGEMDVHIHIFLTSALDGGDGISYYNWLNFNSFLAHTRKYKI